MRRIAAAVFLALPLGMFMHACAALDPIADDACGNSVIEEGEDCDTYSHLGMACRAASDPGACRFDCSEENRCSRGFDCGADAICRAPQGRLERRLDISDGANIIVPNDFDLDGTTDAFVAGPDGLSLAYLDPDFEEQDTLDLFFASGKAPLVAGDLTDDGSADIAFADGLGIGVVRGSDERRFIGTVYPTFLIPDNVVDLTIFGTDVTPTKVGDEALALVEINGTSVVLLVDTAAVNAGVSHYVTNLTALPALVLDGGTLAVDGIPTGRLDPASPCEQYVLAFRSANRVFVGTPCQSDGSVNGFPPSMTTPVPIGIMEVDVSPCGIDVDSAFILDVDADGILDVVVTPSGPEGAAACVAHGPFQLAGAAPAPVVAEPYPVVQLLPDAKNHERILVVGHLNADAVPDLVTSHGIFLSQASACPDDLVARPESLLGVHHCGSIAATDPDYGHYNAAAVGDMNGNGVLDVAMATDDGGDVVLYSGFVDGTFAAFTVEGEECPHDLALGDLDGDGLDDLVYADGPCSDDPDASDLLTVAFGRVTGGPEEPLGVGRLGVVEHVTIAKVASPLKTFDGLEDVGVLVRDKSNGSLSFSILLGSTRRQLQAPFVLAHSEGTTVLNDIYLPMGLAIGSFAGKSGSGVYEPEASASKNHRDLAAAALLLPTASSPPNKVRLWLLAAEGEAELATSRSWPGSQEIGDWPDHDPFSGFIAAANLDADPADEVVYASGRGIVVGKVQPAADGTHPEFTAQTVDLGVTVYSTAAESPAAERANVKVPEGAVKVPLLLADLDGDDWRDILLLGWDPESRTHTLVILWNDQGSFDASNVKSLPLDGEAAAFLAVNFDGDPQLEIFVAGDFGVTVVDVQDRELIATGPPLGWNDAASPSILSMASADFDRDGVPDLVFGYEGSFSLYRSLPTND